MLLAARERRSSMPLSRLLETTLNACVARFCRFEATTTLLLLSSQPFVSWIRVKARMPSKRYAGRVSLDWQ